MTLVYLGLCAKLDRARMMTKKRRGLEMSEYGDVDSESNLMVVKVLKDCE